MARPGSAFARGALAAGVLTLVPACVPTARDPVTYEAKAAQTAEKMASSVATGQLLAQLAGEHKLFNPYASVAADGAEGEADEIRSTFDAIQPPDEQSIALRNMLDDLLEPATDRLSQLRITARQGHLSELARFQQPLGRLAEQLMSFQEQHS